MTGLEDIKGLQGHFYAADGITGSLYPNGSEEGGFEIRVQLEDEKHIVVYKIDVPVGWREVVMGYFGEWVTCTVLETEDEYTLLSIDYFAVEDEVEEEITPDIIIES